MREQGGEAASQVKQQEAYRREEEIRAQGEIVKERVLRAISANQRLVEMDADLRQSGLAEFGGKSLVLLARSGAAWNALSPMPIVGNPIHATDWLAQVDRVLGE